MNIFKDEVSPTEYFSYLKGQKHMINVNVLQEMYNREKIEMDKMINNGQRAAAERLLFHLKTISREQLAIENGFNMYVFRDDIDNYIDKVAKQPVKIIDLENFERSIPDQASSIIKKARPLFDQFYVVFTDYTKKDTRQIKELKRQKDPIVFGAFCKAESQFNHTYKIWNHRMYYITDWVDEYCDLTLDKFISEMPTNTVRSMVPSITVESLEERLNELKKEDKNAEA